MPSEKRQRKREGRDFRRAAMAAARKRQRRRRQGIWAGLVVVAVGVLVGVLGFGGGGSAKVATNNKTAKSTTTTAAPAAAPVCPKPDGSSLKTSKFSAPPPQCIDPLKIYVAHVTTDVGSFDITMDPKSAPKTVNNFVFLAEYHYFDGTVFHRVIPDFVVQGGDPTGTGTGGPGYTFADELPKAGAYKIGSVAMANSGPNTNGSQFFVVVGSQGVALPPQYSLFGQVTSGMPVVNNIAADGTTSGTPKVTHKIISVSISVQ